MKKNMKSILAKTLAFAMAFSLMAIAPGTESEAAKAKKPTIKKKVSITVGQTKKVKVTSKKKVKKGTKWTLDKKGKKVVKLGKKAAKSVKVTGKKEGKGTLTAKVKVGKKTYKLKSKITVTAATTTSAPKATPTNNGGNGGTPSPTPNGGGSTPSPTPNGGGSTPTPTPIPRVGTFTANGATLTVDESATCSIPLTELNETTFTCESKRPPVAEDKLPVRSDIVYSRDGSSVSFTSNAQYNSGVSYYVNPVTSEDQLTETEGGFTIYKDTENMFKDMSAYDYIRLEVTSANEMNLRTYNYNTSTVEAINGGAGFPSDTKTSETYEGGWIAAGISDYMEEEEGLTGQRIKAGFEHRTLFIPIDALMDKGSNPATLMAVAFCAQAPGEEVTIHCIDFVKVNYDTKVEGIVVSGNTEVKNGKTITLAAEVTPSNATRKRVAWSSSNESLATVNYKGVVSAAAEGTGEVTITAAATDGSGKKDEYKVNVVADSGDSQITTHVIDFSDETVELKVNGDASAATKSAAGIEFTSSMNSVDLSGYLTKHSIDMTDYANIVIEFDFYDEAGEAIPTSNGALKIALATSGDLNGFSSSLKDFYPDGPSKTIETSVITPEQWATFAGFNFQFNNKPENAVKLVIRSITLNPPA